MSLLLDALNKADQERKRNETTPGISSNHEQRTDEESRGYSLLLIIAGVIGLGLLLAGIYWLGQRSTAANTSTTTNISANTVTAPTNTKTSTTTTAAKPVDTSEQQLTNSQGNPAVNSDEKVADLYQQNIQVPPSNAAVTISAPTPEPAQAVADPAPVSAENIPTATSIAQFANLPELHALPNNILEKVPSLSYSEHNYDINGGSVKINGTLYHVNEQIAAGIIIDKILEDGMILHIDSYSFKMRAMNSWINM